MNLFSTRSRNFKDLVKAQGGIKFFASWEDLFWAKNFARNLEDSICNLSNSLLLKNLPSDCILMNRQLSVSTLFVLYCSAWPKPHPWFLSHTLQLLQEIYFLYRYLPVATALLQEFFIFLWQEFFSCDSNLVLLAGIFPYKQNLHLGNINPSFDRKLILVTWTSFLQKCDKVRDIPPKFPVRFQNFLGRFLLSSRGISHPGPSWVGVCSDSTLVRPLVLG